MPKFQFLYKNSICIKEILFLDKIFELLRQNRDFWPKKINFVDQCEFLDQKYSFGIVCPCKLILFPADRKVFFYAGKPKLFYEN